MCIKGTYWNGEGKYQAEYEALSEALVPNIGNANTLHGEHLRCVGICYYDRHNNGLGNNITPEIDHLLAHIEEYAPFCRDSASVREMLSVARVFSEKGLAIDEDDCTCGWDDESDEVFGCSGCNNSDAEWHHDQQLEDLLDAVIQYAINKEKAAA